jgi:hypothetical protein
MLFFPEGTLLECYRMFLPLKKLPDAEIFKDVCMCEAGLHRHPIPIIGSHALISDHLKNGHEVDLTKLGLKPQKVTRDELNVPFIKINRMNGHFALITRELRHENRVEAARFVRFAQRHNRVFTESGPWDSFLDVRTMKLSRSQRREMGRNATTAEKQRTCEKI